MKRFGMILVDSKDDRCFFHMLGDEKEYYDTESLCAAYPDFEAYIQMNKIELERALLQQEELLQASFAE